MPDVYANITSASAAMTRQIANVLERRAADPQQRAMRESYFADIAFPENARVLDLGCGTGAVTRAVAAWPNVGDVVGIDPSPELLAIARELGAEHRRLTFAQGDARTLSFEDASFDLVLAHTTLCHVPNPERALAEAHRVLEPGGLLAVFDGDYATTTVALGDFDPLQACVDGFIASSVHDRWLLRRLPSVARSIGFEIISLRSHGYVQNTAPDYMLSIVSRGAEALVGLGRIGQDGAEALRAEAQRRAGAGEFFGHIAYVSVLARKGR